MIKIETPFSSLPQYKLDSVIFIGLLSHCIFDIQLDIVIPEFLFIFGD